MAGGITVYSSTERLAPVTGAKQQAPGVGFGEGVGEAAQQLGGRISQFAQAQDAYNARVEEAGVMELDAQFSNEARTVELGYLQTNGRNAIDARQKADEAWDALASRYSGLTSSPRQRAMMEAQLAQRRSRWATQRDNHLSAQTEVWQVGVEDASLATTVRDAASLRVGTPERTNAYLQVGARLDDIARRRGWGSELRAATGFETFSNIHTATVQQLRDEDPEQALQYLEEHRDQIDPGRLPELMSQTRDDAYRFIADRDARGFVDGFPAEETVEIAPSGEAPSAMTVAAPVSAAVGSRFGPRRGRNHEGVDYPVPVGTPVVASLPGVVRLRNDPDGYGTYVEIDHGNGTSTRYAHLQTTTVREGQRVEQGQAIALSGGAAGAPGAGNSQGPHLHYEFLRDGQPVDPQSVVGRSAAVAPGRGRPAAQAFVTEDDVLAWADERAGGDWRLRQHLERAGLAELSRRRGGRADAESEAARVADEWRAANPGAAWSSAPASIRSGVSPSYRAQMAERDQSDLEQEGKAEDTVARNTSYLALKDEAAANPAAFLSRDLEGYRGILTEGQYSDLREDRRRLATRPAAAGRTPDQQVSALSQVISTYARQVGIETTPARMSPEDAARLAAVREYMSAYARTEEAKAGRPPTQEELIGALRVAVLEVRTPDNETTPYASAGGRGRVQVPGGDRRRVVRTLEAQGLRNPTDRQIETAYVRMVYDGEIEPPRGRF